MSIIHEALKKVEEARHGYSPAPAAAKKTSSSSRVSRKVVVIVAFATFIVLLGFAYMLSDMPMRKAAMQKEVARPSQDKKAVEVKPAPTVNNAKGIELYRAEKFKEAAAEFNEALKIDAKNPTYHNNLGLVLMADGDEAGAEAAFTKALELKPDYPEALNNFGALLEKKGRMKKAVESYEKALSIDPAYTDAHLNMGIALEKAGDIEGALTSYDAFMKTSTDAQLKNDVNRKTMKLRSGLIIEGVKRERL